MADYPLEELGGKTPLEISRIPNMDSIAKGGQVGMARMIPSGLAPGSDIAILSIFGYDPSIYYTGRGPLEAANMGLKLDEDEIAFRCNLVTAEKDILVDYSAGHISSEEAKVLISFLNERLGSELIRFYPGVSYRHLMVARRLAPNAKCVPPHDITGGSMSRNMPRGEGKDLLIKLMNDSRTLLEGHEINRVRIDLGENPANMIWLWGQGAAPKMPKFSEKFGVKGSVISAVDLIKGIGKTINLRAIEVPGATGYYDTDYSAKARYALKSLKDRDFVFIHVEAPDEAGHTGDLRAKISAIENFDRQIVGEILANFKQRKAFKILVLPDHPTPISVRTHTDDPVCFAIYGKDVKPDGITDFNEVSAKDSQLRFDKGHELMGYFIGTSYKKL